MSDAHTFAHDPDGSSAEEQQIRQENQERDRREAEAGR
jgi:hypothetical protein